MSKIILGSPFTCIASELYINVHRHDREGKNISNNKVIENSLIFWKAELDIRWKVRYDWLIIIVSIAWMVNSNTMYKRISDYSSHVAPLLELNC